MNMNEKETKPGKLYMTAAVLVTILALMGYFLFFSGEDNDENLSGVAQMQELTGQVQNLESDVKEKKGEISGLARQYKEKTGKELPVGFDPLELGKDARALLERRINEEKDVSAKSLLEDILEKNNQIRELNQKIAAIEKLLPSPHIVTKGEEHYRIALDFLVDEKGVEQERAVELLEQTALFDELIEGFKVWNFYTGGEYGTSVTRGDAAISPNTVVYNAKKKLTDARDQAISQRDQLAKDTEVLQEKQNRVIAQMELLAEEKGNLVTRVNRLDQQVNSLFYLLDSQQNLKKKGILKSGFLTSTRLRDASPGHFNRQLDLRSKDQLLISALDLGIQRIKDVTLYPKFYKKQTNYKVEITGDNRYAVLTLLEKAKFKNERVVIAVK